MHRDSNGWWVQDYAGESVPAAGANSMEWQRRLALAESLGLPKDLVSPHWSDDEIEVQASLYHTRSNQWLRPSDDLKLSYQRSLFQRYLAQPTELDSGASCKFTNTDNPSSEKY